MKTSCRMIKLLASACTRVHPGGGVMIRSPRTLMPAIITSPAVSPAGAGIVKVLAVGFAALDAERNWIPVALAVTVIDIVAGGDVSPPSFAVKLKESAPV